MPIGTDGNGDTVFDTLFVDGWVPDLRFLDDRDAIPLVNVARDRSVNNTWQFGPVNNPNGFITSGANGSANAWLTNLRVRLLIMKIPGCSLPVLTLVHCRNPW